jgi:hypothetical protein
LTAVAVRFSGGPRGVGDGVGDGDGDGEDENGDTSDDVDREDIIDDMVISTKEVVVMSTMLEEEAVVM